MLMLPALREDVLPRRAASPCSCAMRCAGGARRGLSLGPRRAAPPCSCVPACLAPMALPLLLGTLGLTSQADTVQHKQSYVFTLYLYLSGYVYHPGMSVPKEHGDSGVFAARETRHMSIQVRFIYELFQSALNHLVSCSLSASTSLAPSTPSRIWTI